MRQEKCRETEEERLIRKNKERGETEEERKVRKEKERESLKTRGRRKETENERKARKENESAREDGGRKRETSEERRIRKEKENGRRPETEEERRKRKDKEKATKNVEDNSNHVKRKRESEDNKSKNGKAKIKTEVDENINMEEEDFVKAASTEVVKKEAEENSSDDDTPLAKRLKPEVKKEVAEEEDPDFIKVVGTEVVKKEAEESSSEDETPLAKRINKAMKVESGEEDTDDEPLAREESGIKMETIAKYEDDEEDFQKPSDRLKKKKQPSVKKEVKPKVTPEQKAAEKAKAEMDKVWKWWEEEKLPEGTKWREMEHKGPMFAPEYELLPEHVRFWYEGKVMALCPATEEVATFYGRMLDHDYTTREVFNKNFFGDWRKMMKLEEKEIIRDLSKCDFSEIDVHFKKLTEERKARPKAEKDKEKEENAKIAEEIGTCTMDGHRERIGNYRTEPPGLFRGRGDHPKQGKVKTRIQAEDITINCSKMSKFPVPPEGHQWKAVQHDDTVTWLAGWKENVQGQYKYVMLNASSRLKGEKDWAKYEIARKLKEHIVRIREEYTADMRAKEMATRQRAVALYFIDKLALRAGNEKDADEEADTVGCCSLRVEHIELHQEKDGHKCVVEFDFLGKDSMRYYNCVPVDKRVFKNVGIFMENKKDGDDLFDRLDTSSLNKYLKTLMPGLTAKVFRTYNASMTLQEQLEQLTDPADGEGAMLLSYNRANREVAVLCNHQRAAPKAFDEQMGKMDDKENEMKEKISKLEKAIKKAKKAEKKGEAFTWDVDLQCKSIEKAKDKIRKELEKMEKLELARTDKSENKTIALGTSKLNYLDPRISVQWCKTHPGLHFMSKVYNKTQREKFRWAIDMVTQTEEVYVF